MRRSVTKVRKRNTPRDLIRDAEEFTSGVLRQWAMWKRRPIPRNSRLQIPHWK